MATHQEVMSRLEGQDAVIAKSGGTAPDDHVTMSQRHAARRVGSAQSPEQKDRRQSEGDGHDRGREITLVLVLMQRQSRPGLVPVDETRVGREASEARPRRRLGSEVRKHVGHGRPAMPGLRIMAVVAVTGLIGHPPDCPTVGHRD